MGERVWDFRDQLMMSQHMIVRAFMEKSRFLTFLRNSSSCFLSSFIYIFKRNYYAYSESCIFMWSVIVLDQVTIFEYSYFVCCCLWASFGFSKRESYCYCCFLRIMDPETEENETCQYDTSDLENQIVELANLAINFDKQKKLEAARFYYQVVVKFTYIIH